MTSKLKTDVLETVSGSGTIALTNQLSGMTTASLPALGSAQMPTGSVLQCLYVNHNGNVSSTSTAYADSGKSITITPSSTSSKIYVSCSFNANLNASGVVGLVFKIYRGTTSLDSSNGAFNYQTAATNTHHTSSQFVLDAPSTTSAVTYSIYFRSYNGVSTTMDAGWGGIRLSAMEIAG